MSVTNADRDFAARIAELARDMLRESGQLTPVAMVSAEGKPMQVVALDFGDDFRKELSAKAVRRLAASLNAERVMLVTEAWQVKLGKGAEMPKVRPINHPDRVEIVSFQLETNDGGMLGWADITTDKDGNKRFGTVQWHEIPRDENAIGRMQNLLPVRSKR